MKTIRPRRITRGRVMIACLVLTVLLPIAIASWQIAARDALRRRVESSASAAGGQITIGHNDPQFVPGGDWLRQLVEKDVWVDIEVQALSEAVVSNVGQMPDLQWIMVHGGVIDTDLSRSFAGLRRLRQMSFFDCQWAGVGRQDEVLMGPEVRTLWIGRHNLAPSDGSVVPRHSLAMFRLVHDMNLRNLVSADVSGLAPICPVASAVRMECQWSGEMSRALIRWKKMEQLDIWIPHLQSGETGICEVRDLPQLRRLIGSQIPPTYTEMEVVDNSILESVEINKYGPGIVRIEGNQALTSIVVRCYHHWPHVESSATALKLRNLPRLERLHIEGIDLSGMVADDDSSLHVDNVSVKECEIDTRGAAGLRRMVPSHLTIEQCTVSPEAQAILDDLRQNQPGSVTIP